MTGVPPGGRVASIDIGTNSVLLLVAERPAEGPVVALLERATITRLGEGVDRTGELAPGAIERTLSCLEGYAAEARGLGVDRVVAVGTSAMRDARGGQDFARRAAALLGEAPRVISGEEEARLTFRGALAGLDGDALTAVFDIGGGSTELVLGRLDGGQARIERAVSLDVGSVRLSERYLKADPPSPQDLAALVAFVDQQLAGQPPLPAGVRLVGVAGTVTTLAAVAHEISPYDGARVHGLTLGSDDIRAWASRLAAMPLAERRQLRGMEPKRADVIHAGAQLADRVVRWAGASAITVSDRGVRWGLALEALARGEL